jgi:hypothetical protein
MDQQMTTTPPPLPAAPQGYREAQHFIATTPLNYAWLTALSFVGLVVAFFPMTWWWLYLNSVRGDQPVGVGLGQLGWSLLAVVLVLPLHELIHGWRMRAYGHTPRYGIKAFFGIPLALYATADNALFTRAQFIDMALAPLVVITLLCLPLMAVVPSDVAYYVGLAAVLNASGASGDVWMTMLALTHPADALVRDEADGVRFFVRA